MDKVEHPSDDRNHYRAPRAATEMMEIEHLIRYTERAVGLMKIEH